MAQTFTCTGALGPNRAPARITLAYETQGTLNAEGDNCVLLPGYYTSTCASYRPWIGAEGPFDPRRWFIVSCALLGGGESTFAVEQGDERGAFATIDDNVRAQRTLLAHLGVRRVRLVAGWSMGGMQAFDWAARCPELVRACLPVCATATCHPVNDVFLRSIKGLIEDDEGAIDDSAGAKRRFGRVYATWAFNDEFFAREGWRAFGYESQGELLERWADDHAAMDAGALHRTLMTWLSCTEPPAAESHAASSPRLLALPSTTDRYFRVADARSDAARFGGCAKPLVSDLGHIAGRPGVRAQETATIARFARLLLDQ
ncbi:MAG: alpha/beta fold hydrolase [Eggerthellaceae bacterium]|nr:alpha/beta fold hydrolase [Eggerthellaceae bacterium]